jgi:hypothetical protein
MTVLFYTVLKITLRHTFFTCDEGQGRMAPIEPTVVHTVLLADDDDAVRAIMKNCE